MKIKIDIDCTPEEARACLGLPDVAPLQDAVMDRLREQLLANLAAMEPEALLKTWLPAGIESFERVVVLYWLDQSRRDLVRQSPKSDGRTTGTFALRSPVRPNPIGISRVRLVARHGSVLEVRGLDCLDGTPLVDLKPDRCTFTVEAPPKPGVS